MSIFKSVAVLATVVGVAAATSAAGDGFPDRSVQLVFPLSPGTPTFAVSQIIADAMGANLGVQMPVVAKPGAGGVTAFAAAMAEPNDGYTVIDAYVAPLVIAPLFNKVDYTCDNFTPLYAATSTPLAIVSRVDEARWTDFPSFMAFLKANPGETRYTAAGELSLPHLAAARMLQVNDAVSRPIPYNDLADGFNDLRSGILDWMIINPGMYAGNPDKMRVLAVLSDLDGSGDLYGGAMRTVDFGVDIGLKGMSPAPWDWWVVQKGVPDAAVETLRSAMAKALADPEVKAKLANLGYLPTGFTPDQYSDICTQITNDLKSATSAISWEKEQIAKLN